MNHSSSGFCIPDLTPLPTLLLRLWALGGWATNNTVKQRWRGVGLSNLMVSFKTDFLIATWKKLQVVECYWKTNYRMSRYPFHPLISLGRHGILQMHRILKKTIIFLIYKCFLVSHHRLPDHASSNELLLRNADLWRKLSCLSLFFNDRTLASLSPIQQN